MPAKIILFGGSFDPVHKIHIEILRFVHDRIGADKSILIPARRSPLKPNAPVASNTARLCMLQLAVKGYSDIEVSDIEFNLPEPSYSYHTISHFKDELPGVKLYWLAGADISHELHKWYRIKDILQMCEMIIVCRGGYEMPDFTAMAEHFSTGMIERLKENLIHIPPSDLSSTEVRDRINKGLPAEHLLCKEVAEYIKQNHLYRERQ